MRLLIISIFALSNCFTMVNASADEQGTGASYRTDSSISSDPQDLENMLNRIEERRGERESVFAVAPLKSLHDESKEMWDEIYQSTHIKMGLTLNHLNQWLTDAIPGKDKSGMTTDADLAGTWELLDEGKPTQGKLYFHFEGRWDYGTTGPQTLGFNSLAAAGGTGNAFSAYIPTFLLRNFYWEQGSKEAKWVYRIGKITPDSILATSQHISPVTTFLSNAGTGLFVSAYPDSGLGMVGVWYPSDRYKILGLVSDANANRQDFGDIAAGDLYVALELSAKIFPRTNKAGFSKVTFWHSDGTKDGQPINASSGAEGWGMTVKLEQELTNDGQVIGILRWGKSWDKAAIYDEQAGAHLLYYNPFSSAGLKHDVVGVAANWIDSYAEGTRDEYNLEVFYRFPLFPGLDTRLSYQYVNHPALTTEVDSASVFSLGFRTVF